MRPSLLLVSVAVVISACGSPGSSLAPVSPTKEPIPPASAFVPQPPTVGPRQIVFFGHVVSLVRSGGRFVARVDPALILTGMTASRAAVEDGVLAPGEPVPNDNYVVDEGHRLFTYRVAANAHVTMITNGVAATPISVSELAQIVKGRNPKHRRLFEPKNGFWIRAQSDTIRALDQQYSP